MDWLSIELWNNLYPEQGWTCSFSLWSEAMQRWAIPAFCPHCRERRLLKHCPFLTSSFLHRKPWTPGFPPSAVLALSYPSCALITPRTASWEAFYMARLHFSWCFHYLQSFLKALSWLLGSSHKQTLLLWSYVINRQKALGVSSLTNLFTTWSSQQLSSSKPSLVQK